MLVTQLLPFRGINITLSLTSTLPMPMLRLNQISQLTAILRTIQEQASSGATLDKTIDMLLESIGFDESEVRSSEKEFILMIISTYRPYNQEPDNKYYPKLLNRRRHTKFRTRDLAYERNQSHLETKLQE